MSFQAYLYNIEKKIGKSPDVFIMIAKEKGFGFDTKAGEIVSWLKDEYELGHGQSMALTQVIKNGAQISDKHVETGSIHSDESNMLRLDGLDKR